MSKRQVSRPVRVTWHETDNAEAHHGRCAYLTMIEVLGEEGGGRAGELVAVVEGMYTPDASVTLAEPSMRISCGMAWLAQARQQGLLVFSMPHPLSAIEFMLANCPLPDKVSEVPGRTAVDRLGRPVAFERGAFGRFASVEEFVGYLMGNVDLSNHGPCGQTTEAVRLILRSRRSGWMGGE